MELHNIELSTFQLSDYDKLLEALQASYPNWQGNWWTKGTLEKLVHIFPEGQFILKADGQIVGAAFSMILSDEKFKKAHTYVEVTDNYSFSTHDDEGTMLYGIEIFVRPEYRGNRLGNRLYEARKRLCEALNLESIVFGGRIPIYAQYGRNMSPLDYINKVKNKQIYDPVLSFQLSNDFNVKAILKQYMPQDKESFEYAVLLEWNNVFYDPNKTSPKAIRRTVRIGLVQWKMRLFHSVEELMKQVEFFVDSVSAYRSDFAVFPELFNAPLLSLFPPEDEAGSMRKLAALSDEIVQKTSTLAVSYNVNVITGSLPYLENGQLYNVGFVCHRSGKIDRYEKIHITPDEAKYWGLRGGNKLKCIQTDAGKIGVLICYDSEFPELSRLLADQGMQILFVPFLTDTQNAYLRVRICSQARAIENECYVAITGSTGNLPEVDNMDLNYSQAAVFTPSDFAFPFNGIKNEATPNSEMVLITDVDLKLLDELNMYGSVRNLKDRRKDFYELKLS